MIPTFQEQEDGPRQISEASALRALMNPRSVSTELFEAAASFASSSGTIDVGNLCGVGAINRVVEAHRSDLLPILAKHGADMNRREACGYTPLMMAALLGSDAMVGALLDGGADPSLLGVAGDSALFFSILGQSSKCVALLLEHGANADLVSHNGATPLGNAISFGFLSGAELLLEAGASSKLPAFCRDLTDQPIFLAIRAGCHDFCELLLRFGASVDDRDTLGRTPLMLAALLGHQECVRLLLPLSNVWAEDHSGNTAFDVHHRHVARLFADRRHSETRLFERQSQARSMACAAASSPPKSSR